IPSERSRSPKLFHLRPNPLVPIPSRSDRCLCTGAWLSRQSFHRFLFLVSPPPDRRHSLSGRSRFVHQRRQGQYWSQQCRQDEVQGLQEGPPARAEEEGMCNGTCSLLWPG